jgi:hypothetical protein
MIIVMKKDTRSIDLQSEMINAVLQINSSFPLADLLLDFWLFKPIRSKLILNIFTSFL